jgi:hypothetical protein
VNRGNFCERCERDGMGRDWGRAGIASRWLMRGGISGDVMVGGARSKGAVINRITGCRCGCFLLGSYLSATV